MSSLRSRPASLSSVRIGGLHRSLNASPSLRSAWAIPGVSAARFNSTSSTPPTSGAAATPTDLPDVPANGTGTDVADLSALDINSIPEKIGYLKDLGLDFGWGPSAMIEYMIEHIHIWSGLPWWASIVGTGLLIRLALLKPMFGAADTSAKINNVKHITTPLRAEMIKHTRDGNTSAAAKARVDMTELHREHGIKPWKSFVPFLQIPFGIGCFRVVRGMSELPVPGLAAESVAWLQDLTVADPFYILPAVSSIAMYLSMKVCYNPSPLAGAFVYFGFTPPLIHDFFARHRKEERMACKKCKTRRLEKSSSTACPPSPSPSWPSSPARFSSTSPARVSSRWAKPT